MSKSQLEKVLEHLINEDVEAAEALLHDFILGKARQIHKELMEEADGLEESSLGGEEYFEAGEVEGEEGEEGEGEVAPEAGEGEEEAAADIEGEIAPEAEVGGEKSVEELEAEVQDLQADLADLKAQFEKMMDVEGEEHGDELNGQEEEVPGGEEEVAGDISEPLAGEGDVDGGEVAEESFDFDAFEDLDESFELEPVKVDVKAGTEIGTGGKIAQNNDSPIPQKKVGDRAFKGKPVEIKAEEHKGYDREPAPTVKDKPLLKNQVKNAQANLEKVSKEGDKSALINKTESEFGGPNDKSPIGSKGSRTGA